MRCLIKKRSFLSVDPFSARHGSGAEVAGLSVATTSVCGGEIGGSGFMRVKKLLGFSRIWSDLLG